MVDLLQDQNLIYPNILVGDFNLPDIAWLNGKGEVKVPSSRTTMHKHAIDLFLKSNLRQLVNGPTHEKGNTLDLVLVDKC